MKVRYLLSSVVALVNNEPIAAIDDTFAFRHFSGDAEHVAEGRVEFVT